MSSSTNSDKDSQSEKTLSVVKVPNLSSQAVVHAHPGRAWCPYMLYSCIVVGMSGMLFGIENSMVSIALAS